MLKNGIKTAHNRSLKPSYKHLTLKQVRLVKLRETYDIANRFLYGCRGFYSTVKRVGGVVDWGNVDESLMDVFTNANKSIEKYNKQDESLMDEALTLFNQTQFNFGQSF